MKHVQNIVKAPLLPTSQPRLRSLLVATGVRRLAFALAAIAGTLGGIAPSAHAVIVKTDSFKCGNQADFGSGLHVLGSPANNASMTWDYSANASGLIAVSVRVRGTLYHDSLLPGQSMLRIRFLDINNNILNEQFRSRCCEFAALGAADPKNQLAVDVSFSHVNLRRVEVQTGSVSCNAPFAAENAAKFTGSYLADITRYCRISSSGVGTADFGSGGHHWGIPDGYATIAFTLQTDGRMRAVVSGRLYWDANWAGTARLIIDWQNASGTTLFSQTINESGPWGGNAAASSNQTNVSQTRTDGRIARVRIRVGEVSNGSMINTVGQVYSIAQ